MSAKRLGWSIVQWWRFTREFRSPIVALRHAREVYRYGRYS